MCCEKKKMDKTRERMITYIYLINLRKSQKCSSFLKGIKALLFHFICEEGESERQRKTCSRKYGLNKSHILLPEPRILPMSTLSWLNRIKKNVFSQSVLDDVKGFPGSSLVKESPY